MLDDAAHVVVCISFGAVARVYALGEVARIVIDESPLMRLAHRPAHGVLDDSATGIVVKRPLQLVAYVLADDSAAGVAS